jgi:hypothetical protein
MQLKRQQALVAQIFIGQACKQLCLDEGQHGGYYTFLTEYVTYGVRCNLAFDMSGDIKAKPLGRPLDGGVRPHCCTHCSPVIINIDARKHRF